MTPEPSAPKASPARTPDAYLILLALALLAFAATWFVTPGRFAVAEGADGRTQVVAGSYEAADAPRPAPLLFGDEDQAGLIGFLFEGLVSGDRNGATIGLMAFLFITGGAFGVILKPGSMERALHAALYHKTGAPKPGNDALPAMLFVAFSLGGAVFGMGEEAIVFVLIVAPALIRSGYDSITAVVCTYAATQVGFATSWMNPFSLIIAQGIADLPTLSGLWFRVACWGVFTAAGALFLWRYARGVRLKPKSSVAYAIDQKSRKEATTAAASGLSFGDVVVLLSVAAAIAWIAWGVTTQQYYLPELAGQFLALGLGVGVLARILRLNNLTGNDLVEAFREGAMQMAPAVLVVAAAKGVVAMMGGDDPDAFTVLNTALNAAAGFTAALPDWAAAWGMLAVQSVLNLAIVSGSGQAALTMPLMAPLADLSGVTRQTAVLAFQFGDGFTNMMTPASAALMGSLAAARLDWVTWLRFVWKPMIALLLMSSAAILIAHAVGYA
jgi:uncharacterized ion transporter superfamily protein YfcC